VHAPVEFPPSVDPKVFEAALKVVDYKQENSTNKLATLDDELK
jgi:hypothetical protein